MAEKGTLIADQTGGESFASHDCRLEDNDSNARVVQLVDKMARPAVFEGLGETPLRSVTATDSLEIDPLSALISANTLDVSDAESFVVYGKLTMVDGTSSDLPPGSLVITPIIMSEDATPVLSTLLTPQYATPVTPETPGDGTTPSAYPMGFIRFQGEMGSQPIYPVAMLSWPTFGAKTIGFHVTFSATLIQQFELFAIKTSCAGRNAGADNVLAEGGSFSENIFPGFLTIP